MRTRVIDDPGFILAGLATDTTQPNQAADAGPLAIRFFAPGFMAALRGRIDPDETVALYSDWRASWTSNEIRPVTTTPGSARQAAMCFHALDRGVGLAAHGREDRVAGRRHVHHLDTVRLARFGHGGPTPRPTA